MCRSRFRWQEKALQREHQHFSIEFLQSNICSGNLPLDVGERLSRRDVIDDDDAVSSSVVGWGDGAEPLLAGGVPDLELHPEQQEQRVCFWAAST